MSHRFRHSSFIRCRYLSWSNPSTGFAVRLPMLHVRLRHKNIAFKTTALIDSGATSTFVPTQMAQALQIDLSTNPDDAIGAGGSFKNIRTELEHLSLVKGVSSVFDEFENIKIWVPVNEDAIPYMVLGRDLIFKRYDIKFEEVKQKMTLKRCR